MTLAQSCPLPQQKSPAVSVTPTVDHLLDTPLDELLAEFGVDVAVLEMDERFTGGVHVRNDGSMLFVRPAGRPDVEWEMMARAMLGKALHVPLPPLPDAYELSEL